MENEEYAIAYKEVSEILKYIFSYASTSKATQSETLNNKSNSLK